MQLYARVFVQILDSSIAEDFECRHVFEDLLKVCDMSGCIDMTRMALARRFNLPLERLNRCIEKLEGPDPASRDPENGGRRLVRLSEHRDWGWRVLNWAKYEGIRNRADVAARVARHREKQRAETGGSETPQPDAENAATGQPGGKTPHSSPESGSSEASGKGDRKSGSKTGGRRNRPESIEACVEQGKMLGIPELVSRRFYLYNDARAAEGMNGEVIWMTGGEDNQVPVGNWVSMLKTWAEKERGGGPGGRRRFAEMKKDALAVPLAGGTTIDVSKLKVVKPSTTKPADEPRPVATPA